MNPFLYHSVSVTALVTLLMSPAASSAQISKEPITPIPLVISVNKAKARLGMQLFNDVRLSRNNTISCASCHNLSNWGIDGMERSVGIEGRLSQRNAPTVFNSRFNFVQFWDGRARTLEAQIDGPLHDPDEMGTDWPSVITKLSTDSSYKKQFKANYPKGITAESIKESIAEFERSLITPDSRFDRFLRGDTSAINEREQMGYQLFKSYGCISCHHGMAVGGGVYEKLGVVRDYFSEQDNTTTSDLGRFNITGVEDNRFEFKVPSLRLAAHTAPYLHNGSVRTLQGAVQLMAIYQLGWKLPADEVEMISEFIASLAGDKEAFRELYE